MEIKSDEIMASFDVVSVFTNVSIPLAIDIVQRRLEFEKNLRNRTTWTIEEICEALEICFEAAYLYFRGKHYKQIFGTPMG